MKSFAKALLVALLAALPAVVPTKAAEKTIAVISDIHLMAPSLLDSPDNQQWRHDLANSKTMQELSATMLDLLVEKILTQKPDILLITGDLTKDGEVESHHYVRERLDRIRNAGIKVYVIPGNHDRGFMERALVYANDTSTVAEQFNNATFAEFYKDYGYGNDTQRFDETTLNYVVEPIPGLTIIGLDTAIWCWYNTGAVEWACQQAIEARKKGNVPILMQHHPLMPHYYCQDEIFELSVPEDYLEAREQFANAGIRAVLSGHTHASDIARYTSTEGNDIFDISVGCPISYPCDYRVLKLDGQTLKVTTPSLCDDMNLQDKNFSSDAEYRLLISVKRWAEKWLATRNIINDFFTSELAYCFVLHAYGDEPGRPESESELAFFRIIYEIAGRELSEDVVNMLGWVQEVIKSMLCDYQDPEDPDNVIKDRELTIDMSFSSPVGINEIKAASTDDAWYTLQGMQLEGKPSRPGIYIHQGHPSVIR